MSKRCSKSLRLRPRLILKILGECPETLPGSTIPQSYIRAGQTSGRAIALCRVTPDDTESHDRYVGQGSNLLCAPGLEELGLGTCGDGEVVIDNFRPALSIRKGQGRALKRLIINAGADDSALDPKHVSDLPVDETSRSSFDPSSWTSSLAARANREVGHYDAYAECMRSSTTSESQPNSRRAGGEAWRRSGDELSVSQMAPCMRWQEGFFVGNATG
ncbi:hypothetical protein HD554DRAFT_2037773 [Boletus coccyginus]|nr:hypothetical protein HD554DRAFT_2037773 [Boletus coccyginus]